MTDVLVTGAAGKMGALSAQTIARQPDLRLVALVDPRKGASAGDAPCFSAVDQALALTSPQAALEFSVPAAVYENTRRLLEAGVPTVVGTTGLRDEQVEALAATAAQQGVGLVVVPNFALGAVLLMRFAREAARYYEQAEVIEMHEAGKLDAPSGTSLRTAHLMAESPGSRLRALPGDAPSRGLSADGVRIHSVRLPGMRGASGSAVRRRGRSADPETRLALAALVHERRAAGAAARDEPRGDRRGAGGPPRLKKDTAGRVRRDREGGA